MMAGCPDGVAVPSSSMESTCLRIRSLLNCGPIRGHSASSRVISSTESLDFLAGFGDLRPEGSAAADSLLVVALCTGSLRESPDRFAALHFRSACDVGQLTGRTGQILREMRISRDGMDHILKAASTRYPVGRDGKLSNVRPSSQKQPAAPPAPAELPAPSRARVSQTLNVYDPVPCTYAAKRTHVAK